MIIKGKEYQLKFTNRALINIEKRTKTPIMKLVSDEDKITSLEVLSILAHEGCNDVQLRYDDVIDAIELPKIAELVKEVEDAFVECFNVDGKKKVMEAESL
jgi:predicted HAD superfamily phosphohydrolase